MIRKTLTVRDIVDMYGHYIEYTGHSPNVLHISRLDLGDILLNRFWEHDEILYPEQVSMLYGMKVILDEDNSLSLTTLK